MIGVMVKYNFENGEHKNVEFMFLNGTAKSHMEKQFDVYKRRLQGWSRKKIKSFEVLDVKRFGRKVRM